MLKDTIMITVMKRTLSILTAAALLVLPSAYTFAAQDEYGNFSYSYNYTPDQFRDVKESDWFARYVEDAYNLGFINGKTADEFVPEGLLTFGEAVTLVARFRNIYFTGRDDFTQSVPFYSVYADYLIANEVLDRDGDHDYSRPATRAELAELFYNALPPQSLTAINTIPDYGIADVVGDAPFSEAVYALYRAGIISGSDRFGTFFPNSNITRAEASAIVARLAIDSLRVNVSLPSQLPVEIIYQRSVDAVFMIETFDEEEQSIRTGSGFFISSDGLAVTNLHIISTAASATVTLSNGDVYDVRGAHAICLDNNIAIISIDSDDVGRSYLNLADSDFLDAGSSVYTIGSPLSLTGTITEGIISNTSREVDDSVMIQFSAPISFGSGGSPLLNARGQVIGIASSSFSFGQNLNLAVPINFVKELPLGQYVLLGSLFDTELDNE